MIARRGTADTLAVSRAIRARGGVLESRHVLSRRRHAVDLAVSRPGSARRAVLLLTLASLGLAVGCQQAEPPARSRAAAPAAPPSFVGSAKCASCHPKQTEAFRGSDHDRAMQAATEQTVLGNFDQARTTQHGVTSTFSRRDGKFLVRTDGPDGKLADFEIAYTFGADPL